MSDLNNDNLKEDVLKELKDIFENVNRWLQFAEAKNGALIGINGIFLFKSIDFFIDIITGKLTGSILLSGLTTLIFLIGILLALKSFFPNDSVYQDEDDNLEILDENEESILIFYNDIYKFKSSKKYLMTIYKYYYNSNIQVEDLRKIEVDYAKEILINSRITSYKNKIFKLALISNFVSIFVFFIFLIVA